MRLAIALALVSLSMTAACNRGGSSVAELEDRYGDKQEVTQNWLIGRWAEVDDRDCERAREFQRGGDLMDDGERREWELRAGRGDDVTLEIDRDEFRAERYGSTLVLVDEADRTTEYKKCDGALGAGESGNPAGADKAPGTAALVQPAPSAPGGDPQLATEMAAGVTTLRRQLPIRNGAMTITDVATAGSVLTLTANIAVDVTPEQWTQVETRLQERNCSGSSGTMIRRGAVVTTNLTDSTGESRSITTSSCAGSM